MRAMNNDADALRARDRHLRQLNEQYVRASLCGDVEWYREHLADEFVCIDSDGSVYRRDAFLHLTALGMLWSIQRRRHDIQKVRRRQCVAQGRLAALASRALPPAGLLDITPSS